MPDRQSPPPVNPVVRVELPKVDRLELSHEIPTYMVRLGSQEVLRVDVLFDAGRAKESRPLAARGTGTLMKEGTRTYTSAEIAERVDFYGASLSAPFQMDSIHLSLHLLTKHAGEVLPVLASVLHEPTFPERELENFKLRYRQQLEVELRKTDVVAYREMTECLFGATHPYGYNSSATLYENLARQSLQAHYDQLLHAGNCTLLLSGKADGKVVGMIDDLICKPMRPGQATTASVPRVTSPPAGKLYRDLHPSVQTAIRVGKRLFTRRHPDYMGLYVLNTILGGYFGSRLMTNIREEKGYTYNVFSSLDSMRHDGYLYVGTEVGHEFVEPTLREIYREMERLCSEPVPGDELQMVKNYLMGSFLTLLDGPFQVADVVRGFLVEDLPFELFDQWMDQILQITPEDLMALANRYLQAGDWWEVIIGQPPVSSL